MKLYHILLIIAIAAVFSSIAFPYVVGPIDTSKMGSEFDWNSHIDPRTAVAYAHLHLHRRMK